MSRQAEALIDLAAFRHNYAVARRYAPQSRAMASIKANAYGHGAVQLARALPEADAFGVACIEEAVELRDAGITQPILLLEGFFEASELPEIEARNLEMVIQHRDQLARFLQWKGNRPLTVWLKLDSGMHRVGLLPEEFADVYEALKQSGRADSIRLMTHMACADDPQHRLNADQLKLFESVTAALSGEISIANSAALISLPRARGDWVRPGIMLYGANPMLEDHPVARDLKPVMTLRSRLIAVRDLAVGETVGYGGTWRAEQPSRIGTVALGYGDGYPRHARNGTPVLVNGHRAVIAGRVSMDMITVDLTTLPEARIGDEVVFWGEGLPAWEVAKHAETIAYELFTGINRRVHFNYVGECGGGTDGTN